MVSPFPIRLLIEETRVGKRREGYAELESTLMNAALRYED